MSPLRIYLFGVPRFERDEKPINISRRKAVALLAYLGTTAQAHSRDALATMFWPEYDQSKARANLRRELSRIKSILGEESFDIQREQVALKQAEGWWLDVAAFQSILESFPERKLTQSVSSGEPDIAKNIQEIREAVALFTDEFMAGFSLPDSHQFDEWQFFQKESLNRSLRAALQQLIYWHTTQAEYEAAIEYARQLLSLDNLSESAHRQLMQLYAWSDQQGAAIRQYEQCRKLLEKEIGVEPEEETIALYKSIKSRQLAPPDVEALRLIAPWLSAQLETFEQASLSEGKTVHHLQPMDIKSRPLSIKLAFISTPFIGREVEQTQLFKLLVEDPHYRLVSVVGPGGAGKTRLALEAASAVQEAFPDGVYLIPLASLASAKSIPASIAEELNFRFHAAAEQEQQLFDYLHKKKLLLVMDNFEHVLSGVSFVTKLLQAVPQVKVLVTSRERLNLVDEAVISLGGLDCPTRSNGPLSSEDLSAYEAVKLLVQSARRVQPDFELQPQDYEPAARLCRLVEGIPLAIILAAGWLEMFSIEEVGEEISKSLDFLESQAHDIPERQRSLRAVFNASWSSLAEEEQEALERLTIFQGSFTRQAALAVTKTSLTTLLSLIQKAWLQRNQDGRYQIHELQRQYASEILNEKPPAWRQAHDEHATFYAARLQELFDTMRGPNQDTAFDEVTLEFENIRIAWDWLVERKEFKDLVQQLLPPIYRYCEVRIKSTELLQLVDVALGALESDENVADYLNLLNILLTVQSSFYSKGDSIRLDRYDIMIPPAYEENISRVGSQIDSLDNLYSMGLWGVLFAYLYGRFVDSQKGQYYLQHLIQNYRMGNQPWELALALQMLGGLILVISLKPAQKKPILEKTGEYLEEALEIFERLGDKREYSYTLLWLGGYHSNQQHWDEAISIWQEAQANFDAIGDTLSSIHWLLGDLLFKIGDYESAFQYYHEIREKYLQRGQKRIAAYALSFESLQALRYSNIEHARQTREHSLRLSQEVRDPFGEAWSTWEMGEIHRVAGDYDSARAWFERAKHMFQSVNDSTGLVFYHRGFGDIALAKGDEAQAYLLFEESLAYARRENFTWGATYALAGMGRTAAALKNFDDAHMHLSEGLKLANSIQDIGLALVVLAGCANYYAERGENEQAFELCHLVTGHYAAWRETKTQAATLLNSLKDHSPDQLVAVQKPERLEDIWDMTNRLLEKDFKPN